jgi:hypothetical protein
MTPDEAIRWAFAAGMALWWVGGPLVLLGIVVWLVIDSTREVRDGE